MSKTTTIVVSVLGVIVMMVMVLAGSYISAYNYGNRIESQIEAVWENNENILSQYGQKVMEAGQVPGMMTADVKDIMTSALTARYGEDGSQAAFQWIQEQNASVDPALYTKIQQIIEAGRDEFRVAQTRLIDNKRQYKEALGSFWRGFWMSAAGYPKLDLAKYEAITTDYADSAFTSGKESGPIKLR